MPRLVCKVLLSCQFMNRNRSTFNVMCFAKEIVNDIFVFLIILCGLKHNDGLKCCSSITMPIFPIVCLLLCDEIF